MDIEEKIISSVIEYNRKGISKAKVILLNKSNYQELEKLMRLAYFSNLNAKNVNQICFHGIKVIEAKVKDIEIY